MTNHSTDEEANSTLKHLTEPLTDPASAGPVILRNILETAKWIQKQEIKTEYGKTWKQTPTADISLDESPLLFPKSLYGGSAGIGFFFLKLYMATNEPKYLQEAETVFGVPLFNRTKNRIQLNENGNRAAEEISLLLKQTDRMIKRVQDYDRMQRTISIGTAAAVPLTNVMNRLAVAWPNKSISTDLKLPDQLLDGLRHGAYHGIILPWIPEDDDDFIFWKIAEEHLMTLLPKEHPLAGRKSLSLSDLDGENMLLYAEIGFWEDIVRSKMPHSRFLVQNERYSLEELVLHSVLPCFASDLTLAIDPAPEGRIPVPLTDPEVNVSYYLLFRKENRKMFLPIWK